MSIRPGTSSLFLIPLFLSAFIFSPQLSLAQNAEGGAGAASGTLFEAHLLGGGLVSNLSGIDTTLSMVGIRGVYSPSWGHVEAGYMVGRGSSNITYRSVPVNYRMDIQLAGVSAFAVLGGRVDFYRTNDDDGNQKKMGNGWQIGGGLILDIGPTLGVRGDFEYRLGPGKSLYTGIAFVFRF